jgi:Na+/H+ antiporter NhaD/arsenite permease-like protein
MGHEAIQPNPWMILPFVVLLATIALGPLLFPHWWHNNFGKTAISLGAVTLCYYLFGLHAYERVLHVAHEYVSFIALIGSLFVVSGGIHITVKGEATPLENVLFLLFGAVIANVLGTTGASMLLIRPWIRMNKYRITAHHIVFFIFIVSNVGGCLTPIGDPPLFLGYLKGVPFWWVAEHCWPMWAVGLAMLLTTFFVVDRHNYLRAPKAVREKLAEPSDTWKFEGGVNVLYLIIILGAVFINNPPFLRETIMAAAALASWKTTKRHIHDANQFNFYPIQEVVILFIGIFATMMPALDWLGANAKSLGTPTPALFYWGTGALSAMLDNAPTYLSFLQVAQAAATLPPGAVAAGEHETMHALLQLPGFAGLLVAISIGAVFFGACTYIGNGPNFMVKAIADQQKVHTPTFLGYVFKYTLPYLLPMLLVVWLVFFRK